MLNIQRVETTEQLEAAYSVRTEVFVHEQGVPAEAEIDGHESEAVHVLAVYNGQPAGAGRVREAQGMAKLERVCVLERYRGNCIGQAIMDELEAAARDMGLEKAKLHAQTQASGFYIKLGYTIDSNMFLEENIPHVVMIKWLTSKLHNEVKG